MNFVQESLAQLQALYSLGKKISIIGPAKRASVVRTMLLEKMVEKILLHDHSILLLFQLKEIQELDVSLIASAARNIMEITNLYFYISQRGLEKDSLNFRAEIMSHNEAHNEIEITKKLGFSQNCFRATILNHHYINAAEQFQKFPQFTELSANEQAWILSGRKATFQMKSPHILEKQIESAIYNLLSKSIHGLFLGLSSNSLNYAPYFTGFFHAEKLLVIALQVNCIYTAHVAKDY